MKFDVVVGNPPYQDSNRKSKVGSGSTLWITFSLVAFDFLKPNGFLAFVTPQSWMKPKHKVLELFKQFKLHTVNTTIAKYFSGVGSTFSYWILQNEEAGEWTTRVDDMLLDLRDVPYLVDNSKLSIHRKVVFDNADYLEVQVDWQTAHTQKLSTKWNDGSLSKTQNNHCCYPVMHTNAQTLYCSNKTKGFDNKKVMFTDSGYLIPRYDDGSLGSTERCKFITVSSEVEGRRLVGLLSSKLYQFIVTTAKWSGFNDNTVMRSLPKVDLTRSWTDEELYAHFNLTDEEIKLIEDTIK